MLKFIDSKKARFILAAPALAVMLTTGCATPAKGTAIGGTAGAGAGGLIGGIFGGGAKNAALGAVVGAAAGAAVGNYLDKQSHELAQVADTKRTEDGILVNLKSELLFETGKTTLKPHAIEQLSQLGDILTKYPADRLRINGFTDSTGSASFNELLSKERAVAVRDVLAKKGVKDEQMLTSGFGPAKPVASNKTAQGRAANRRVEVYIDVPADKAQEVQKQQAGTAAPDAAKK